MLAVHEETGLAAAGQVAAAFGTRLAEAVVPGAEPAASPPYPPTGFAGGAAGVAHAMRRLAATGAVAPPAPVPQPVVGDAGDDFGWCCGVSGVLLATADCPDHQLDPAGLDDVVAALAARRPLRDASLCHGEFGIMEALSVLARRGHAGAAQTRVRYAARAIGALDRGGPRCGTPNGVPSPGLLTGLAGIGYGFLRLGFADQVPSVLLLEPAIPDR
jgi:lantibiotic modifying enzyme